MMSEKTMGFVSPSHLSLWISGISLARLTSCSSSRSRSPNSSAHRGPITLRPVTRCVVEAQSLADAAVAIRTSECGDSAVIVRGALKPVNWIERLTFPRTLDVRDIRLEIEANGRAARLPSDIERLLPPCARDALCALAVFHAMASENPTEPTVAVRGRVALVQGVPCRRFHVDKVNLRTLATLSGPGCVIAPRSSVDLEKLLSPQAKDPSLSNEAHDAFVLAGGDASVEELDCGDVAFLPGSGLDDDCVETAAVHRSPRTEKSELRLVIQVDDWEQRTAET